MNVNLGVNGAGDAAVDAVTINGTVGVDVMSRCPAAAASVTAIGTTTCTIAITNAEPANDTLTVNTSAGDDIVSASGLGERSVLLTVNGGADNDILVGSQGNDTINGDDGNDPMFGRRRQRHLHRRCRHRPGVRRGRERRRRRGHRDLQPVDPTLKSFVTKLLRP